MRTDTIDEDPVVDEESHSTVLDRALILDSEGRFVLVL